MIKRASLKMNIVSLFLLQGSTHIITLVTLPYLVRVLGPEKFGLLAFAQSFIQYFSVLTDYGFNLSATKQIAVNRDHPDKISEIFCSTMCIKIGLMVLSFLLMGMLVMLVPKFRSEWLLYFLAFLSVPGTVIFPVWFFQGMEQMRYISIVTVTARLLSAVALFVFVHGEGDYVLAAAIQSGGLLAVGLLGISMVWKVVPLRLKFPSMTHLIETLKDGWHIFISMAAVSLYSTSNIFFLGLVTNNELVGFFSAADKLITAVKNLLGPVSQAIYPRIIALSLESREKTLLFIRKCLVRLGVSTFFVSCALFIVATPVVRIILGAKFGQSVELVRWMAFVPFMVVFTNVFGTQTMLTFNLKKEYSRIIIGAGLVNLMLLVWLSTLMAARGAAIAVMITETLIPIAMGIVLHNKGFNFFTRLKADGLQHINK